MRGAVLAVILALAAVGPAAAQTAPNPNQADLLQLSELLGALHYLRPLCGASDAPTWRAKMSELIATESAAGLDELMAGAFNRGYDTFRASYHSCTPRARALAEHYLEEGARLADDLARRLGN
jgi:uncharacterized protein (TIGR02301 family)